MDSLYQNYSTTDFHRKAQAVASNIHKISQNGNKKLFQMWLDNKMEFSIEKFTSS